MRLTWKRQQQTTHAINSEASIETTGLPVHRGRNKQVNRSSGQQVNRSTGHQVIRSTGQQVNRSKGQQVNRSFTHKNNKGRQFIPSTSGRNIPMSFLAFHQQLENTLERRKKVRQHYCLLPSDTVECITSKG
jgi:hypothetical protein